jgi:lysophospholipase L1-like esterase
MHVASTRPLRLLSRLLLASLALAPAAARAAGTAVVLGDSIGVGVSMASGLPRLARTGVSLRGDDILTQIRQAPRGATAYVSLGANDAASSLDAVPARVGRILAAAQDRDLRVVWIGPPCVRRGWNRKSQALDALLQSRLAGRALYVSAAEPRFCEARIKAGDGVHFTMKGYAALWAKARAATAPDIDPTSVGAIRATLPGSEGGAHD